MAIVRTRHQRDTPRVRRLRVAVGNVGVMIPFITVRVHETPLGRLAAFRSPRALQQRVKMEGDVLMILVRIITVAVFVRDLHSHPIVMHP